ncbi:MAG: HlyD family secretion protein [Gemmatimonadaceae bacterium]|nr:HlyD family secretion protein [Gloeobacterales cyanobacterium ES-bin-141]
MSVADTPVKEALPTQGSTGRRINPLLLVLAGTGILAAAVFGYQWWQHASIHEETDNAVLTGHLHQISSRINGTVRAVLIQDNQTVNAGDTLVKLDTRDFELRLRQARTALETARREASTAAANIALAAGRAGAQKTGAQGGLSAAQAGIATAQAAVEEARAGIPTAQARLAQARANLIRAELDYRRYQALEVQGALARQQLDSAKATYDVALADRQAAEAGVRQAQSRLAQALERVTSARAGLVQSQGSLQEAEAAGLQTEVNRNQYLTAQAQIAQAEVALSDAQLQLSYTNVTAPTSGRIGRRTVEAGQRVQPGQPLLAVVEDRPWVVANFKETQLERMRPGQPVEIEMDTFRSHTFTGRVDSIAPGSGAQFALLPPDNATGNFTKIVQRVPVKIVFDPESLKGYEDMLVPGMSTVVSVNVGNGPEK